ncbi:MAG: hypothetical protein Q7U57_12330 [Methylovulum sp.]|nr:hypothetical protein [Methylovulum sp.]
MIDNKKQESVRVGHGVEGANHAYGLAIAEIERLENELQQTKTALAESLKIRDLMNESLVKCIMTLNAVEYQLKSAEAALTDSNTHIVECVGRLKQDNRALKLSGEMWLNRSINLKFELLMAKDTINRIKAERDLAIGQNTPSSE